MPEHKAHFESRTALVLVSITVLSIAAAAQSELKLTYDKPAAKWTEALPLGNGRVGAMVFGGTEDERLQINESTLWGGGPQSYVNPEAYAHLEEIRQLIFAGQADEAEKLSGTLMGRPKLLMPYQPFCDLRLHFPGHDRATEYRRELHLDDAIAVIAYRVGSVSFLREAFVSYPDQVLVVRITADQPGQVTFTAGIDSPQPRSHVESTASDTLQLTGQIQPRQNSPWSWTGSWDRPGMRFAAVLKVLAEGGSVRSAGGHLEISGANAADNPVQQCNKFEELPRYRRRCFGCGPNAISGARPSNRTIELRQRHEDDFQPLVFAG